MIIKEVKIDKIDGVQKNDAQQIVNLAVRFDSEIMLEQGNRKINLKSMMGILSMGLKYNSKVIIFANGDDEKKAIDEIVALFERNFTL